MPVELIKEEVKEFKISPVIIGGSVIVYLKDTPSYYQYINNDISVIKDLKTDEIIGIEINNLPFNKEKQWL